MSTWEGPNVNDMYGWIIATHTSNKFLISAHRRMMLYIGTKIYKNISKSIIVTERTQSAEIYKGI